MAQRRAERLDIGRKSRFTPLARTVHSGPPIRKKITAIYHILRSYQGDIAPAQVNSTLQDGLAIAEEAGAEIKSVSPPVSPVRADRSSLAAACTAYPEVRPAVARTRRR